MECHPVGIVHSPFTEPHETPRGPREGALGTVEVFEEFRPGLRDLDGFSHVILLCYFDRCKRYRLLVTPPGQRRERGLFATRAPARPNPIGLSVVRLLRIENATLHVEGVDILDGTPLLDIKPYIAGALPGGEVRSGWTEAAPREEGAP
jgi:tRNA-Thr(GGU) m(6)t(6)A37 methyltransferase TsaA